MGGAESIALVSFRKGWAVLDARRGRSPSSQVVVDEGSVKYLKSQPWPFPQSCMVAFRATADCDQELVLDDELLEAKWWDRSAVRKACGVPGAVMSPDVAKEAFATDPSLELLVPPKKVVARELIEAWLSET